MSHYLNLLLLSTMIAVASCTGVTPIPPPVAPAQEKQPMTGADQDEHGCKGSAGYQWSQIKKECIQIFSTGIRLDAKAVNLDKTMSAFIVFKSADDEAQVELFIPGTTESILLDQDKKVEAGDWKNDAYVLSQWKGMDTLKDNKKTVLYEGAAVK